MAKLCLTVEFDFARILRAGADAIAASERERKRIAGFCERALTSALASATFDDTVTAFRRFLTEQRSRIHCGENDDARMAMLEIVHAIGVAR